MFKRLQILFLILVPLVFLVIGFKFDRTKYGTDPESAYLFNGLNIAMGKPVGHFDHPGTTVQIYSAVVIGVTHLLRFTNTNLQTDVLTNSELYIEVLRMSFIVFNSLLIFLVGFLAFSSLKNIWLTISLQLTPFLSTTLIEHLATKISPEQLLFSSTILLTILILKHYSSLNKENKWFALLFGLLAGFGMATKFTFLPLLVIPFIVLKGNRNKVVYLGTIIPSFILFTLPAAHDYKVMFKWLLSIASHTGIYGQGSNGIIDAKEYVQSISKICMANKPMLFALLASLYLLIILFVKSRRKIEHVKTPETAYILALFLALTGTILMVAKHYYNNHYLFPALSIMGLVFVFIYLWAESFSKNKNNGIMKFAPPSIAVVFLVLALINKPYLTLSYEGYRQSNKSTDETMARIERDYPGYVKTYYYPGSFNQYAQLRWGNVYAKQFHTDMLMKLFPEGLFYDVRDNSFKFWETTISPEEFLKKYGSHILLVGGPINDNDLKLVENRGLKLKKLFEGRVQVVYEVDTTQSAFFRNIACERTVARVLKTDFETLSIDKQWIVINGYPFSKTSALSNEHPRSGKFSFSMPEKDTYAMESELKDIVPGEQFEVSIWRYGGDKDALLVASAANADLFYKCSTSTGEKDIKGWNKISLIFRIPSGFKENKIKLYLWNHGNKPVWFDDFELTQKK